MAVKTRSKYVSKGQRNGIVAGVKHVPTYLESYQHKVKAWLKGQNPWVTVPGPSKKEAWKRVRANSLWGDPRFGWFFVKHKPSEE